jgi:phosphohistidine phosphatase SixA
MTAEHVAIAAGIDEQTLQQRDGLEPEDDASVFLDTLISKCVVPDQKILLVGHEPFMSTLAQLLITGDQVNLSLNFGRGALLGTESLGQGVGRIWQLRFYLTAENLTRLIWLPD